MSRLNKAQLEIYERYKAIRAGQLAVQALKLRANTQGASDEDPAADIAALVDAEARHRSEAPQRRATGGGGALRVPPGFTSGETFQAAGRALACRCGFSVNVIPDAGRFAVLLSTDDERTPPHSLGSREAADKAALSVALRHSESCGS